MKTLGHLVALGALLALAPVASAQATFRTVEMTKEYTNGPRAGTQSTLKIAVNGAVSLAIRDASGATRSANNQATPEQLRAVRDAFRAAEVGTLPGSIFDANELLTVGSVKLTSTLTTGGRKTTSAKISLYAAYSARVRPLVDALGVLETRLEPQVRAGFRSITLTTRTVRGPEEGRESVLSLGASSRATFELSTPAGSIIPIAAEASRAELDRVIAAFKAAGVASIPDGYIVDGREILTYQELELVIVMADGSSKSFSARKAHYGLFGAHRSLEELGAALDVIAARFEGASIGIIGGLTGN
jgi:hypothetical protein